MDCIHSCLQGRWSGEGVYNECKIIYWLLNLTMIMAMGEDMIEYIIAIVE